MFEDYLIQKLKEAAVVWGAQKNALIESEYLGAAKRWADAKVHGSNNPPPVIPFSVKFEVVDFGIVGGNTETPISSIKPESFLPTYGTDINAISKVIGGPIPGQTGKFYATAASNPHIGDYVMEAGYVYVYQRPTPFGGFWVKAS